MIDASAQGSCTITPINHLTTLTVDGGVLADETQNVKIECRCMNDSNVTLTSARWFDPNNMRIFLQNNAPNGAPYRISSDRGTLAILVIPTFNDSYTGTYTCEIGLSFPPHPFGTIILTLFGKEFHR